MIWKNLLSGLDPMGESQFSGKVMLEQKAAAGWPIG